MTKAFIYVLKDPETDKIFYVGKTVQPKTRLYGHIGSAKYQRTAVEKWIYGLASQGKVPIMEIVKECDESIVNDMEKLWINTMSENGILLNSTHHAGSGKRSSGDPKNNKGGGVAWSGVHFPPSEIELWEWVQSESQRQGVNVSKFIRQALECYRLILEKYGQDWRDKIND